MNCGATMEENASQIPEKWKDEDPTSSEKCSEVHNSSESPRTCTTNLNECNQQSDIIAVQRNEDITLGVEDSSESPRTCTTNLSECSQQNDKLVLANEDTSKIQDLLESPQTSIIKLINQENKPQSVSITKPNKQEISNTIIQSPSECSETRTKTLDDCDIQSDTSTTTNINENHISIIISSNQHQVKKSSEYEKQSEHQSLTTRQTIIDNDFQNHTANHIDDNKLNSHEIEAKSLQNHSLSNKTDLDTINKEHHSLVNGENEELEISEKKEQHLETNLVPTVAKSISACKDVQSVTNCVDIKKNQSNFTYEKDAGDLKMSILENMHAISSIDPLKEENNTDKINGANEDHNVASISNVGNDDHNKEIRQEVLAQKSEKEEGVTRDAFATSQSNTQTDIQVSEKNVEERDNFSESCNEVSSMSETSENHEMNERSDFVESCKESMVSGEMTEFNKTLELGDENDVSQHCIEAKTEVSESHKSLDESNLDEPYIEMSSSESSKSHTSLELNNTEKPCMETSTSDEISDEVENSKTSVQELETVNPAHKEHASKDETRTEISEEKDTPEETDHSEARKCKENDRLDGVGESTIINSYKQQSNKVSETEDKNIISNDSIPHTLIDSHPQVPSMGDSLILTIAESVENSSVLSSDSISQPETIQTDSHSSQILSCSNVLQTQVTPVIGAVENVSSVVPLTVNDSHNQVQPAVLENLQGQSPAIETVDNNSVLMSDSIESSKQIITIQQQVLTENDSLPDQQQIYLLTSDSKIEMLTVSDSMTQVLISDNLVQLELKEPEETTSVSSLKPVERATPVVSPIFSRPPVKQSDSEATDDMEKLSHMTEEEVRVGSVMVPHLILTSPPYFQTSSGLEAVTENVADELLIQTKPFHIPLDNKEVIEYLTTQSKKRRWGRPKKVPRNRGLCGRKPKKVEDAESKQECQEIPPDSSTGNEEAEPVVKRPGRKRKNKTLPTVDDSPRKLRRVAARLSSAHFQMKQEKTLAGADTTEHVDISTLDVNIPHDNQSEDIVDPISTENLDPISKQSPTLPNIETSPQFVLLEVPQKRKIGRPRKDSTLQNTTPKIIRETRKIKIPPEPKIKKKMGRPRKIPLENNELGPSYSDLKNSSCETMEENYNKTHKNGKYVTKDLKKGKHKGGRPRKNIPDTDIPKKKLGRPRKIDQPVDKVIKKHKLLMSKNKLGLKAKQALEKYKIKACHVVLEKKKLGRPRKIINDDVVQVKMKSVSPHKISPEGEIVKKKMGRPRKVIVEGETPVGKLRKLKEEKMKTSPGKQRRSDEPGPEVDREIKNEVEKEVNEPEVIEKVNNDTRDNNDELKPCTILLDPKKVSKYLNKQKKHKMEENKIDREQKRFKAEMLRLETLAQVKSPTSSSSTPPQSSSTSSSLPSKSSSKSKSKSTASHLTCEICHKTFVNDNQYRLNRHMAAVHNSDPYCKRCDTMFEDRTQFYSHVKKCKKIERFREDISRPFEQSLSNTSSSLNLGIDNSTNDNDELPVIDIKAGLHCPVCYKSFCSKFSTERHIKIMHPSVIYCKYCLLTFGNFSAYTSHIVVCTEKPQKNSMKLQKLKKSLASKLHKMNQQEMNENNVSSTSSSFRSHVEFASYDNSIADNDYGGVSSYSEFYSSSSHIDLENSISNMDASYSEESSIYASDNSHWNLDNSNVKNGFKVLHHTEWGDGDRSSGQQIQNLAMLEFQPNPEVTQHGQSEDVEYFEIPQHREDDKVYHML